MIEVASASRQPLTGTWKFNPLKVIPLLMKKLLAVNSDSDASHAQQERGQARGWGPGPGVIQAVFQGRLLWRH